LTVGERLGQASISPEVRHGFLLSEGEFTEIQISGADTAALGINADGLIVVLSNLTIITTVFSPFLDERATS
jgi:hypothetical protein